MDGRRIELIARSRCHCQESSSNFASLQRPPNRGKGNIAQRARCFPTFNPEMHYLMFVSFDTIYDKASS